MPRDARAYLSDILECRDAIQDAVRGLDLEGYRASRLIRSSVEREFTIVGEALSALSNRAPDVFMAIQQGRRIIDLRNRLTHGYSTVNDVLVWGIIHREALALREECASLLARLNHSSA